MQYKYQNNGGFYDFTTVNGLQYRLGIYDGLHLFKDLPFKGNIYYIEFIEMSGHKFRQDADVITTIVNIVKSKINADTDVLLYSPFLEDLRGKARLRLFKNVISKTTSGCYFMHQINPFGLNDIIIVYSSKNKYIDELENYCRLLK